MDGPGNLPVKVNHRVSHRVQNHTYVIDLPEIVFLLPSFLNRATSEVSICCWRSNICQDKEDRCSLLITTWCMFPGILLSAKVFKYD